jgi:hypothetical protein
MHVNRESTAISVTGRGDPQGCDMWRLLHFLDTFGQQWRGDLVVRNGRPLLSRRFLVLIPIIRLSQHHVHNATRKIRLHEKCNYFTEN